jgi:hypothetical protein
MVACTYFGGFVVKKGGVLKKAMAIGNLFIYLFILF